MRYIKQYEGLKGKKVKYKTYIITKYKYGPQEYINFQKLTKKSFLDDDETSVIYNATLLGSFINNKFKTQTSNDTAIYVEDIIFQTNNFKEALSEFNDINEREININKYNL